MDMFHFAVIFLLILNIICSIILSIAVINIYIRQKAAELSTHKLEFVPIDPKWGASDKEIDELNDKLLREDPELDQDELMPEDAAKLDLI